MRTRILPALLALILAGCAGETLPNRAGGVIDEGADAVRDAVEPQREPNYESGRDVDVP